MADRNNPSALTPPTATTGATIQWSRSQIDSSSERASRRDNPVSTSAAIPGRRAASVDVDGLPRTHTHDEWRHGGSRSGVKHIRGLVALLAGVQAEILHHADDFERWFRGRDARLAGIPQTGAKGRRDPAVYQAAHERFVDDHRAGNGRIRRLHRRRESRKPPTSSASRWRRSNATGHSRRPGSIRRSPNSGTWVM